MAQSGLHIIYSFFREVFSYFPVFWKCLIRRYIAFFCLATGTIVILLLTSRLEEVARFIAVGASVGKILLFISYQIPYILQIALPIGGFIAGYALSSRMSQAGEITALRSIGKSITEIFRPILAASCFLSFLTFLLLFDFAAKSHLATKKLEYDVRAEEPLALLQSGHFLDEHSIALELSGSLKTGSHAKNVVICMMPKGQDRLTLALFSDAETEEGIFIGETLSIFSTTSAPSSKKNAIAHTDTVCVENAVRKKTPTHYVHEMTQKKKWNVGADHLPMSTVLAMRKDLSQKLEIEHYQGKVPKNLLKKYGRFTSEPWRRISLSLAITTLTWIGLLFGISIQRTKSPFQLGFALIPFFAFMALYLMGKNIDEVPLAAIFSFILSHILLFGIAKVKKNRIEQGISG